MRLTRNSVFDIFRGVKQVSVHPEIDGHQLVRSIFSSSFRRAEILTAGIWLIFRGLKFPPNNEIGENSHLWMGTSSRLSAYPDHQRIARGTAGKTA
jgi:hypothetical protein